VVMLLLISSDGGGAVMAGVRLAEEKNSLVQNRKNVWEDDVMIINSSVPVI